MLTIDGAVVGLLASLVGLKVTEMRQQADWREELAKWRGEVNARHEALLERVDGHASRIAHLEHRRA